ncbi:MAG: winged helix-turn-helix domain-containing protein [Pseudohongiellaceae bacterium]
MNSSLDISLSQARKIALYTQCLNSRREFSAGINGTLATIEHLGYVQIDTLAVVERAHNHTLWNRVDGFEPEQIDQLQQAGKIFEHWAHALAYLPTSNYRYSLPMMNRIANGESHWYPKNSKDTKRVLKRIQEEGPLSAKDFTDKKSSTSMWSRSPSKHALEQLFMEGELMIPKRVNFHKVYDLRERVLSSDINTNMPTEKELCGHLVIQYLKANGIGQIKEFSYLRKGLGNTFNQVVNELAEAGEIIPVSININPSTEAPTANYYCLPESVLLIEKKLPSGLLRILSPFDNAVIQRKRLEQLFDYDYQIECYVPQAKRKYGYFCLPILYNSSMVGRIDAKADRKNRSLHIIHLHIEKPIRGLDRFYQKLNKELENFATFNHCETVELHSVSGAQRPNW